MIAKLEAYSRSNQYIRKKNVKVVIKNDVIKNVGHSSNTYVHETYRSQEITINLDATGWEYLSIEISHNSPNAKKYVLTNVYRSPERFVDELNVFIQEFSSLLNSLQDLNRTSFVCGDLNINVLEINSNSHYNDYFESIYSKGFFF